MASSTSPRASASRLRLDAGGFPTSRPTRLPQVDHRLGCPSLPRPPIVITTGRVQEYQPVFHRLRLSPRLSPTNPEQISFYSGTLGIRRASFSLAFRYSCQHSHSQRSTQAYAALLRPGTLPYHSSKLESVASVHALSPVTLSAPTLTSELLRLLNGGLLLSQPSWLSLQRTSFPT